MIYGTPSRGTDVIAAIASRERVITRRHIDDRSGKSSGRFQTSPLANADGAERRHTLKRRTLKRHMLKRHTLKRHTLKSHTLKSHMLKRRTLKRRTLKNHTLKSHTLNRHTLKRRTLKRHTLKRHTLKHHMSRLSVRETELGIFGVHYVSPE